MCELWIPHLTEGKSKIKQNKKQQQQNLGKEGKVLISIISTVYFLKLKLFTANFIIMAVT